MQTQVKHKFVHFTLMIIKPRESSSTNEETQNWNTTRIQSN